MGSGETAFGLIEPFAQAYELLNGVQPDVGAFTSLLQENGGLEPGRLRRLKRRFLSFRGHAPRWAVDPFELLTALGGNDLGRATYASDASLDRWVRYCWDIDPISTAHALPKQTVPNISLREPVTADEGLAAAFASEASELITAETLEIAVAVGPRETLSAVWDRNEPALWSAWANLPSRVGVPEGASPRSHYDWAIPIVALRRDPASLSRVLRRYPEAIDDLVAIVDSKPSRTDFELDLAGDAKTHIRDRLQGADAHLAGLARLSDHDALPRHLDIRAWRRLLAHSKDEAVHATAYLIARTAPPDHWDIAVLSVGSLYGVLDGDGGAEAWKRLSPHIRGDRYSWDRCNRLIADYADQIKRLDDPTRRDAMSLLQSRSNEAAVALAEQLRPDHSKKFNLFDPWTW